MKVFYVYIGADILKLIRSTMEITRRVNTLFFIYIKKINQRQQIYHAFHTQIRNNIKGEFNHSINNIKTGYRTGLASFILTLVSPLSLQYFR